MDIHDRQVMYERLMDQIRKQATTAERMNIHFGVHTKNLVMVKASVIVGIACLIISNMMPQWWHQLIMVAGFGVCMGGMYLFSWRSRATFEYWNNTREEVGHRWVRIQNLINGLAANKTMTELGFQTKELMLVEPQL